VPRSSGPRRHLPSLAHSNPGGQSEPVPHNS
jgi:hypothetical protein